MIRLRLLLYVCIIPTLTVLGSEENEPPVTYHHTALNYKQRAEYAKNPFAKKLFKTMHEKETNIFIGVNSRNLKEMLPIIPHIGPHICAIKVHFETQNKVFGDNIQKLHLLANQYGIFIIAENSSQTAFTNWAHFDVIKHLPSEEEIVRIGDKIKKQKTIAQDNQVSLIFAMPIDLTQFTEVSHVAMVVNLQLMQSFNEKTNCLGGLRVSNQVSLRSQQEINLGLLRMIPEKVRSIKSENRHLSITPEEAFGKQSADLVQVCCNFKNNQNFIAETAAIKTECWNAYLNRLPQ